MVAPSAASAQRGSINSRVALRGNQIFGDCQACNNIAAPSDKTLAKTQSVKLTHTHKIIRQWSASFGKGFCRPLGTGEELVTASAHRFTAALFYNLLTAGRCSSIRGGARWKRCEQQAASYDRYKHSSE
jgi:hypothetical protein